MPRKQRLRRRTTGWNDDHKAALVSHDYFGLFVDESHERAAWKALRDELLPEWIAAKPGTRPRCWWLFDAPGRRQRSDGGIHPHDRVGADPEHRMFMGKPARIQAQDVRAEYETEKTFLRRCSMLDDAELQELGKEDR
jgi:hypothetical protein